VESAKPMINKIIIKPWALFSHGMTASKMIPALALKNFLRRTQMFLTLEVKSLLTHRKPNKIHIPHARYTEDVSGKKKLNFLWKMVRREAASRGDSPLLISKLTSQFGSGQAFRKSGHYHNRFILSFEVQTGNGLSTALFIFCADLTRFI